MIEVTHLSRYYRVSQPGKGVRGKLARLFAPQYKTIKAADDISLEIGEGEIVGYLGPNGAGKSTTIKLLTGVLYPTAGSIEVNGLVPHQHRKENAYNIGVVYGQRSQLWWDLPLIDSFEILGAMYRLPRARYRNNLDFLTDLLEMNEFIEQPVRKLSLGQRMRGDLAASLLHEPPVLYLDEPTIGLDIISKNKVLEFFRRLNAEKRATIVLTTHNLSDVERMCQRIVIIDKGRIVLDASQGEIMSRFGQQRMLIVEFEDHIRGDLDVPRGRIIRQEGTRSWIEFSRDKTSALELVRSLGMQEAIKDISIEDASIESIITQLHENGLGERENEGRSIPSRR